MLFSASDFLLLMSSFVSSKLPNSLHFFQLPLVVCLSQSGTQNSSVLVSFTWRLYSASSLGTVVLVRSVTCYDVDTYVMSSAYLGLMVKAGLCFVGRA